jgi:hypothetical protein
MYSQPIWFCIIVKSYSKTRKQYSKTRKQTLYSMLQIALIFVFSPFFIGLSFSEVVVAIKSICFKKPMLSTQRRPQIDATKMFVGVQKLSIGVRQFDHISPRTSSHQPVESLEASSHD